MNENLDLIKVLRDCPVGTKLYSPIFGEVEYNGIEITTTSDSKGYSSFIRVKACGGYRVFFSFNQEGKYYLAGNDGECLLFPAKDQRDWSKFKEKQFKPLVRPSDLPLDALAIHFELVEPKRVYWFRSGEDKYENSALLNQLTEITGITDNCPIMNNHIVFSCGEFIDCASPNNNLARTAMMFGVELKIEKYKYE